MRRELAVLVSSIALLGAQTAVASEAYIVPDAATPWVFQGFVSTGKDGIGLSCVTTIEISGSNDAADTSTLFSHSDVSGLSATISFTGGPLGLCAVYMVDPIPAGSISYSGGVFTFRDVSMTSYPGGGCAGDLRFTWDESMSPPALLVEQTLPSAYGDPCAFLGFAELVSPTSGDVRAPGDPGHDPHQDI